jgi:hypothetical protein
MGIQLLSQPLGYYYKYIRQKCILMLMLMLKLMLQLLSYRKLKLKLLKFVFFK